MSTGQIHDLGYKRYVGSRRSFETRWLVIMRHQVATAWRGWWRYKAWLICGVMATAVSGSVLYILSGNMFRALSGIGGQQIKFADGILPLSMTWYCPIGFIVSLTVGATLVAGDVQSGAFTFYFARSVRPRDYVIGKLAGLGLLVALIMLCGPLMLAGLRLGLSDNLDQLIALLPILYKALAVGVLGTLVYAAVPLGFSAVITNRRYALALWAAYYLLIGSIAGGLAYVTRPELAAIDLGAALKNVMLNLFDARMRGHGVVIPTSAALISILGHSAVAIGLVFWRVRKAQQTGVGGSS
jgi:ABC-type transport system involved in multi-copper enzyme maturation permease subunit